MRTKSKGKKMLASDLDGTLILKDLISEKDRQAIRDLRENGYIFTVSTGRPLNGVSTLDVDNEIEVDYYVLLNGALILNSKKEMVKHVLMENGVIKEILDDILTDEMRIGIDTGYKTYLFNEREDFPFKNYQAIQSFDEINEDVSLLAIAFDDKPFDEIEALKNYINHKYGNSISVYRNTKYIDIVPKGCSKGNGVKMVAEMASIEHKDVYTIGDSYNDVAMFEITDNSFTFHRVEEGLKVIAKNIVDDVAQCVNDYILV
ncbi:MAG: HAD-IIB family hydrolase [Sarcina sp.]